MNIKVNRKALRLKPQHILQESSRMMEGSPKQIMKMRYLKSNLYNTAEHYKIFFLGLSLGNVKMKLFFFYLTNYENEIQASEREKKKVQLKLKRYIFFPHNRRLMIIYAPKMDFLCN